LRATLLLATPLVALAVPACNGPNVGSAGCQAVVQQQIPGTALTLLPNAQLLDAGGGAYVLAGVDGQTVRFMTIAADGALGVEEEVPLPDGASFPSIALAGGTGTTLDTVLIGFVTAAANGTDGELHFISAPLDGSPASAAGPVALTFAGAPSGPSRLVIGTPKARPATSPQQAMNAGVAWIDPTNGVMLAFIDNQGALAGTPIPVEAVQPLDCLTVTADTIDPDASFLVSFLRPGTDTATPSWEEGEVWVDGGVRTLTATVAEAGRAMGCALGTPTSGFDYSFAWQDSSGSWLSVISGRTSDGAGNIGNGSVQSYPFVAATDFGGPDVQPPIVGLAAVGGGGTGTFTGDYMVAFARPQDVEIWRLDFAGQRRPGALVLPSTAGNLGAVSTLSSSGGLVLTYADFGSSTATSSRWLVNAVCY
jgi:hypothetical protein